MNRIKKEKKKHDIVKEYIQMSGYIDVKKYHDFERTHPFYEEMIEKMLHFLNIYRSQNKEIRILEIGGGTGIFTLELCKLKGVFIVSIEPDKNCFAFLRKSVNSLPLSLSRKCKIEQAFGETYVNKNKFDIAVSSFADHHIPYKNKIKFYKNLCRNLVKKGLYIVGDEFLPDYRTEAERKTALYKYHNTIIELAIKEGNREIAELEKICLQQGLRKEGDYKVSCAIFERNVKKGGFEIIEKSKIGPKKPKVGGIYVYVLRRINLENQN